MGSIDITTFGLPATVVSAVTHVLSAPKSDRIRKLEHALVLALALWATGRLVDSVRRQGVVRTLTGTVLDAARSIPGVDSMLDAGLDSALKELADDIAPPTADALTVLPLHGRPAVQLLQEARKGMAKDAAQSGFARGAAFGGIYHSVQVGSTDAAQGPTVMVKGRDEARTGAGAGKQGHVAAAAELQALQTSISALFLNTNALYPGIFRTTRRYEAEVVRMGVSLLKGQGLSRVTSTGSGGGTPSASGGEGTEKGVGGGFGRHTVEAVPASQVDPAPQACGLFTSGGTESIIVAVKAHRDAALERLGYAHAAPARHGGGGKGGGGGEVAGAMAIEAAVTAAAKDGIVLDVVAGTTAHPALDKACALLGIRLVKVPVHEVTRQLQPSTVAAVLSNRTMLVYASAPGFAHGVVDPIPAICAAAHAYTCSPWGRSGVPVHVDNCLGGVLLSFLHAAQGEDAGSAATNSSNSGSSIPMFDFRAHPAVSTISMDLHKYGSAPKGASLVAFRSPALRRHAYTVVPDFPGGLYTTPTLAGSKGGAPAAITWHTMVHMGSAGYAELAARTRALYQQVVRTIQCTKGLMLVGSPHACIVAFTTTAGAASPYAMAARMEERDWHVPLLQSPAACHICVTERLGEAYVSDWDDQQGGVGEEGKHASGDAAGAAVVDMKHATVLDTWLSDLQDCAAACTASPSDPRYEGKGSAGIYGAAGVLPQGEVGRILQRYCDTLYLVRSE